MVYTLARHGQWCRNTFVGGSASCYVAVLGYKQPGGRVQERSVPPPLRIMGALRVTVMTYM